MRSKAYPRIRNREKNLQTNLEKNSVVSLDTSKLKESYTNRHEMSEILKISDEKQLQTDFDKAPDGNQNRRYKFKPEGRKTANVLTQNSAFHKEVIGEKVYCGS